MAATGYTPISLYYSATAGHVPLAANLANGELAINIADGKLYFKNASGVVTLLSSSSPTGGAITSATITSSTINSSSVGATTPSTGAFTTLSSNSTTTLGATSATSINSTPIGATTPSTGAFTTLSATGAISGASLSVSGAVSGSTGSFSGAVSVAPAPAGSTDAPQMAQTLGAGATSYGPNLANSTRVPNTTYTNSTGRPIFLIAQIQVTIGAAPSETSVQLYVNSVLVQETYVINPYPTQNSFYGGISAIIPPGSNYSVNVAAISVSTYTWYEY